MNIKKITAPAARGIGHDTVYRGRGNGMRIIVHLLFLLLPTACATVPITERQQLSLVSDDSLIPVSRQQYQEFLASHEVVHGTPESEMVRRVGERTRQAVEEFMALRNRGEELAGYQWEFNLVASQEENAWAMPGGKVAVYSGILGPRRPSRSG